MMRMVLFLLALIFSTLTLATDMEDACGKITHAQENQIAIAIPEMTLDEATSTTEDLAVMSGLYNDIGRSIGGITSAIPLLDYEVMPNLALLPEHRGVCASPAIRMKVGYRSLGVYMDREIPRSSCIYNAIFAHEMHHVAIYKNYVTAHLDRIKHSADAKFNGKIYYFDTLFQAKQYVEILGDVFAKNMRERFFSEVNAEQAALDTQSEYSRMQLECMHP